VIKETPIQVRIVVLGINTAARAENRREIGNDEFVEAEI
jgi:hypothetical protein